MQTGVFWTPDGESFMEKLKNPAIFFREIDIFTCFAAILYEGSMEGV
jgi:hypothetical protein